MKFISLLALLAIIAQCTEGHQMLRSAATKSVDFSTLSASGSDDVASKKLKPRDGHGKKHPRHPKGSFDGSWGGHVGGRHHGPHHPKGSFDGNFDGHFKWAGSFDGSFPGPHGKWPGSFDGSFKGHGKNVPFPGKGKGKGKKKTSDSSEETEQQTTQQDDSGSD